MPVVISPQNALASNFPEMASYIVTDLSVLETTATWPEGSSATLRWSGTSFFEGSGCFSQTRSRL